MNIFCISDGSTVRGIKLRWTLQYDIALCEEMIEAWRGNCSDWKVIAPRLTRRLKPHKPITERGCSDRFGIIRRKNRNTWKRWVPMLYRMVSGQCKWFVECTFLTRYSQIHNAYWALFHPDMLLTINQSRAIYQSSQELQLATWEFCKCYNMCQITISG